MFPNDGHVTNVNIKQNDMSSWTCIQNLCIKVSPWCSCNICKYKAKLNVFLNTHKKSLHKGDDPIKYLYINDLDDIKLNLSLDFKNLHII